MDYGARNPTSITWYAVDEHKRFWAFDELYVPMNQYPGGLPALCRYIKGHQYWERCSKVVADPKMFAKDQNILTKETGMEAWGTLKSIAEMMMNEGIYKIQRGNNDRIAGLTRLNTMLNWKGSNYQAYSYLLIGHKVKKGWWELCNLVYKLDDSDVKNPEEDVVKRNDHFFDQCKYALLSEDIPAAFVPQNDKNGMTLQMIEDKMDEEREKNEDKDIFSCSFRELEEDFEGDYT
jgi:hypothetical protein